MPPTWFRSHAACAEIIQNVKRPHLWPKQGSPKVRFAKSTNSKNGSRLCENAIPGNTFCRALS